MKHARHTKPRVALLVVTVMALTGYALAAQAAETASQSPDRELTVINYNIQHGRGLDGVVDLERTASVIRESGAQVAAIQEVDKHLLERSNFEDQAERLAELLGWHVTFGPAIDWDPINEGEPRRQYGNAILSRYPILATENVELPIHGVPRPAPGEDVTERWSEPRAAIRALLNVRGVRVNVYSTHLQANSTALRPDADHESARQQRTEQIQAILDDIDDVGGLVILAGDLNARPDDPELKALYDSPMVDVWDAVGEGPGYTIIGVNDDGEFEAVGRIDYVFVSPEIGIRAADVPWTEASDHLPVVTELSLPGPGRDRSAIDR